MNRLKFFFVMTMVIAGPSVQAQTGSSGNVSVFSRPPVKLQLGVPIERTIAPRQIDNFTVELGEHKYVQLVADQRGIDVVVQVTSPAGKVLAEVDSPNGSEGSENVSFVAGTAGVYRIAVTPLDEDGTATPGKYEIKIVEIRDATEEEIKTGKNQDAVKELGLNLLNDIEQVIASIHSPSTRIRAQLKLSQLLWGTDDVRATKFIDDAVTTVKEYLESSDLDSRNGIEQLNVMRSLRNEILQTLMSRDPEMALNFLRSTRTYVTADGPQKLAPGNEEAMIELNITNMMANKDPKRALQMAEAMLKKGYSGDLLGTVSNLLGTSPELGAKLASEISAKILAEKFVANYEAANLAASVLRRSRMSIAPQSLSSYQNKMLSESDYRALFQKALTETLSFNGPGMTRYSPERNGVWNVLDAIKSLGTDADSVVPGSSAAVEKKLLELTSAVDPQSAKVQQFQNILANGSFDTAMEAAAQAPKELQDQLYQNLAAKAATNGDLTRAKQIINEHISDPYQRRQVVNNLEQQSVAIAIETGKIDEALRLISTRRTPRERASLINQVVGRIGPGQKRATALKQLEQARGLLSDSEQAEDQEQMYALFALSRAFARYDPKRAFQIIEPLIDQFNGLISAAHTMDGFGQDYFEDGELNLHNGNNVAAMATQFSESLADLAIIDFDHAKATTDRLQLPEIRLFIYLVMAERTIQQSRTDPRLFTQRTFVNSLNR